MSYDNQNIFARILREELPCIRICEDESAIAFMDIMPQAEGHVLIVPREAAANLFELSPEGAAAAIKLTQRIAIAVKKALQPPGIMIAQFNGRAAGQTVEHFHFHVIPRHGDAALRPHASEPENPAKLEPIAARIRAALA